MDRHRSRELQLFGGLLCCPWNQNTLVLRKRKLWEMVGHMKGIGMAEFQVAGLSGWQTFDD